MSTHDWYVLNTRACAKNESQKTPLRSRRGTDSKHLVSSPEYSVQVGAVGKARCPPASSTPNDSAPAPLSRAAPTCAFAHDFTHASVCTHPLQS